MLTHLTLSDNVAKMLRKMILNGSLKPGERINQVHLAEQMNISRGPLREALRLLENEGLVKHETNKGAFVTALSKEDIWEIYTMRAWLEGEAAQLAVDFLRDYEFMKLDEVLQGFEQALFEKDYELMVRLDMDFHRIIVNACRHNLLKRFHQQLDFQIGAMFLTMFSNVPVRINFVAENHRLLVDALKSKDKEKIKREFSDHYLFALSDIQKKNKTSTPVEN